MEAIAIIMTLLVGIFTGIFGTVYFCIHSEQKKEETKRRVSIHPSGRVGPNPFVDHSQN